MIRIAFGLKLQSVLALFAEAVNQTCGVAVLEFSSASYFSQSFRKAEGTSPAEFRKASARE